MVEVQTKLFSSDMGKMVLPKHFIQFETKIYVFLPTEEFLLKKFFFHFLYAQKQIKFFVSSAKRLNEI